MMANSTWQDEGLGIVFVRGTMWNTEDDDPIIGHLQRTEMRDGALWCVVRLEHEIDGEFPEIIEHVPPTALTVDNDTQPFPAREFIARHERRAAIIEADKQRKRVEQIRAEMRAGTRPRVRIPGE